MATSRSGPGPFVYSVADLSLDGVASRSVVIDQPVDWRVELSRVLDEPPLHAELRLTRTHGGVIVKGTVDVDVEHTCPRCLTGHVAEMSVELTQLVAEGHDDDDDPPDYLLDGELVDLEPVLRDETLLALPLQPVCPGGCVELVAGGESDLNTGDSAGGSTDSSPFAVLQRLIEHAD